MKPIMYEQMPADFSSKLDVVSCYIENNDKFLYLRYVDEKLEGKWGAPAGKVDSDELPQAAVLREIYEETNLWLTEAEVFLVDKVYFREPIDYTYYIYKAVLPKNLINTVKLSTEHQDYKWVTYKEAINLPLVFGAKEALDHCIRLSIKTERNKVIPSAYLILKNNDNFLLYLRHNSGFEDGNYGLVAGHIERGESAKQALVREAYEEANIIIEEDDLSFAHVSCRKSDRENIDMFFECTKWRGEIANNEPNKCAELKFFKRTEFPSNVIKYILDILILSEMNIKYSEIGWNTTKIKKPMQIEEFA